MVLNTFLPEVLAVISFVEEELNNIFVVALDNNNITVNKVLCDQIKINETKGNTNDANLRSREN